MRTLPPARTPTSAAVSESPLTDPYAAGAGRAGYCIGSLNYMISYPIFNNPTLYSPGSRPNPIITR
jgi:hypothetical protein